MPLPHPLSLRALALSRRRPPSPFTRYPATLSQHCYVDDSFSAPGPVQRSPAIRSCMAPGNFSVPTYDAQTAVLMRNNFTGSPQRKALSLTNKIVFLFRQTNGPPPESCIPDNRSQTRTSASRIDPRASRIRCRLMISHMSGAPPSEASPQSLLLSAAPQAPLTPKKPAYTVSPPGPNKASPRPKLPISRPEFP
jgi:hypothetical protein